MADDNYNNEDYSSKNVRWVDIDMADNGFIVEWNEKEKKPSESSDHCDYIRHKKLFPMDKKDDAFMYFVELKKAELGRKHEENMNMAKAAY